MSLTRRLIALAFISVLPAIAIWAYTEAALRRAREAEVKELALRQAQLAASELDQIFAGARTLLIALAQHPAVRSMETEACTAYLADLQRKLPQFAALGVSDRDGAVRCASTPLTGPINVADRAHSWQPLSDGEFYIGEYTVTRASRQSVLPVALPFGPDGGERVGVVHLAFDLAWLGQRMRERTLPEGGSVTVADRNGVIIAREPQPERFVGTRIPDTFMAYVNAKAAGATEVVSQDGVRRVLGYVPVTLPPTGIYVSAGLSAKAAYSAVNEAARRGALTIAGAFALALGFALIGGRLFITRPFRALIAAMHAWRRGDFGARIPVPRGSDEFSRLGQAINALIDDVQRREAALRESEDRARLALDAGAMGTWWYDPQADRISLSDTAAHHLGLPPLTGTAALAHWTARIQPNDLPAFRAALDQALTGGGTFETECRVADPEGGSRWLYARGQATFDGSGRAVRMVGVLQDVTVRRLAEDQQRLLLDELNHRVKNTLATVQSIAAQTLRTTSDPAAFRTAFEARLLALSKTHDLLTRSAWRAADLEALLDQELAPYRRAEGPRAVLSGPEVHLPASTAISLGLALHELATNAAKYGALSRPEGVVTVSWTVTRDEPHRLSLTWRERGGPPVAAPTRTGFGSRLLKRSIEGELAGTVAIVFDAAGVTCDIDLPLAAAFDEGGAPVLEPLGTLRRSA